MSQKRVNGKVVRKPTARQREVVAFHEAGHAVAAVMLGVGIRRKGVTIVPSATYAGRIYTGKGYRGDPTISDSAQMVWRAERRAVMSLAGPAAQRKYRPSSVRSYHGGKDWHQAIDLISCFVGSDRELNAYLKLLWIRAEQLVACDPWWIAIQAVAKALLERDRLTPNEVTEITRRWPPGWIAQQEASGEFGVPALYDYPV